MHSSGVSKWDRHLKTFQHDSQLGMTTDTLMPNMNMSDTTYTSIKTTVSTTQQVKRCATRSVCTSNLLYS
uniref:Ovule protein n=1 Tax=Ascaris lumbricoides TaxID=6252 RepID=A0A0M3HWT0_ASCLU